MIAFSRSLYDDLVEQAVREDTDEVCGILGGTFGDDHSHVRSIHQTENVADEPQTRYAIDPAEQFTVMNTIEEAGDDVVGFYHSHPTGPSYPSGIDHNRATWADYSYVIISLDGHPFVGSWRWNGAAEQFEQEIVAVSGNTEA